MDILLHPRQQAAWRKRTKRNVLNCGRRAGKTFFFGALAVEASGRGLKVVYGAPIQEQTGAFWDYCTTFLSDYIAAGRVGKNETEHTLEYNGGQIRAKTAWNIDTWRGTYGDLIIADEYAYMREDPWGAVIQPMLLDHDGEMWFGSTPNRRNHHYRRYLQAVADPERWRYTNFPSTENPHLSSEALAELTLDMVEEDYAQEILAEFIPGVGAVFTLTPENLWVPDRLAHLKCNKVAGVDLGKVTDFSAISVNDIDHRCELDLQRFKGDAQAQAMGLERVWNNWGQPDMIIEDNAHPDIMLALKDRGVPFRLMHTDETTKRQMIGTLKLVLEKQTWKFKDDPVGNTELESYEEAQTRLGHIQYGTQAEHDDTVMARAIAVWSHEHGSHHFGVA